MLDRPLPSSRFLNPFSLQSLKYPDSLTTHLSSFSLNIHFRKVSRSSLSILLCPCELKLKKKKKNFCQFYNAELSFLGARKTSLWNAIIKEDSIPSAQAVWDVRSHLQWYVIPSYKITSCHKERRKFISLVSPSSKCRCPIIPPTPGLKNSPSLCFSKAELRLCMNLSLLLWLPWIKSFFPV